MGLEYQSSPGNSKSEMNADSPDWNECRSGENDCGDNSEKEKERFAKENHSEIERRRRTKMTTFINELADLIPSCNQQNKPDKLSILRYAANHCKNIEGARNHGTDEPALLSLNKFDHVLHDSTRGCLFILEHSGLSIRAANSTLFSVLGITEDEIVNTCFLDLIHYDDVKTVKDMLCANSNYFRRMLDLKNFQIREESYIPGRCNPGQNERRDFVTRIKSEKPEHRNAENTPSAENGYIVVSICATIVGPVDYLCPQSCWALFIRQEQPQHLNQNQACTLKIALDGTVLFCDELLTKILNRAASDVNTLIGTEIWKILCCDNAEKELKDLVSEGSTHQKEARILLSTGWADLKLRPIINPSSKKTEFIIGNLAPVP